MIQEQDVKEQIAAYLRGRVSFVFLERWLNHASQEMLSADPRGLSIIAAASLLVSESADGIISDDELRIELRRILNEVVVSAPLGVNFFPRFVDSGRSVRPTLRLLSA